MRPSERWRLPTAMAVLLAACGNDVRPNYVYVSRCPAGMICTPYSELPGEPQPEPPPEEEPPPAPTVAPIVEGTTLRDLDHRVVAAAQVPSSGEIVVASDEPPQLVLLSADAVGERSVPLPSRPTAVNVSPDGTLAAVSHQQGMTLVDVVSGEVVRACASPRAARRLVITNRGLVIGTEPADTRSILSAVDGSSCGVLSKGGLAAEADLHADPSGDTLYLSDGFFLRCTLVTTGIESCGHHYTPSFYGSFWMDGAELYVDTGQRYRLPDDDSDPVLQPRGRLAGLAYVDELASSVPADRILVLGRDRAEAAEEGTRVLRVFDTEYLEPRLVAGLPSMPTTTGETPSYGRFVFPTPDWRHALVVVQAASPDALHEFGLVRIPLPPPGLAPTDDAGAHDAGTEPEDAGDAAADTDAAP